VASISGVWISPGQRRLMEPRETAMAVAGHGLEGCAHARPGSKRHVLFASADHLRAVGVEPGRIKENFTVEGADVQSWPVGQRLRAGDAVFEVTMVCDPCHLMEEIRPGLQAELEGRRGMLAQVVETGTVSVGDELLLLG
jgi:MOSC domain-containing protein YiiM